MKTCPVQNHPDEISVYAVRNDRLTPSSRDACRSGRRLAVTSCRELLARTVPAEGQGQGGRGRFVHRTRATMAE